MQVVMFVFAVIVMVFIDIPLTLVAIAPLPFVYWVGVRLRNKIFPLQWVVTARQAELATIVDENIQGIRVVKAFNQESTQVQHLARSARRLRWAGTAVVDTRARHAPGMESIPRLGLALVLFYGGLQAIDGTIAIGDLVRLQHLRGFVVDPISHARLHSHPVATSWSRCAASVRHPRRGAIDRFTARSHRVSQTRRSDRV